MRSARLQAQATAFDRLLKPVHHWIWSNDERRVQKLLRFSETEIDGGRDILRAAEITSDPQLRRLYLEHARDEFRHGLLFRQRAGSVMHEFQLRSKRAFQADWLGPVGTVSMTCDLTKNRMDHCSPFFICQRRRRPVALRSIAM